MAVLNGQLGLGGTGWTVGIRGRRPDDVRPDETLELHARCVAGMGFLFWSVLGAALGYVAGQHRFFSPAKGAVAGFLLGPLAVLLFVVPVAVVPNVRRQKCPYCADWVKSDARVCTHCHALLIGGSGSHG